MLFFTFVLSFLAHGCKAEVLTMMPANIVLVAASAYGLSNTLDRPKLNYLPEQKVSLLSVKPQAPALGSSRAERLVLYIIVPVPAPRLRRQLPPAQPTDP